MVVPEYIQQRLDRKTAILTNLRSFLPSQAPITLEIGCGNGHFLTSYAVQFPGQTCIGIDLINKRLERSQKKKSFQKITNLHFLKAEAVEFLEALPAEYPITHTFILFPDPWPKTKHHHNRLIQPEFLNLLASKSTSNALLFYRTDDILYFNWTRNFIAQNANWEILPVAPFPCETPSLFQQKMGTYQSIIAQKKFRN